MVSDTMKGMNMPEYTMPTHTVPMGVAQAEAAIIKEEGMTINEEQYLSAIEKEYARAWATVCHHGRDLVKCVPCEIELTIETEVEAAKF